MKYFVLVSFIFSLTGCGASLPKYSVPEKGDLVSVTVENKWGLDLEKSLRQGNLTTKDQRQLYVDVYKNQCDSPSRIEVIKPEFVSKSKITAGSRKYIRLQGYLKAHRSIWVGPAFHANDAKCNVYISLKPNKTNEYKLIYSQNGKRCFASVMKKGKNEDKWVKDRTYKQEKKCKD